MRIGFMLPLAMAASLAAGVASAATLGLQFDGGTSDGRAKITAAPVTPVGGFTTYGAFGFKMTDVVGNMGSFVAWCLDITHVLKTKGVAAYDKTSTPFTNSYAVTTSALGRIQNLFDANYGTLDTTDRKAAASFQVALWESLYDDDHRIETGAFRATGNDTKAADGFLAKAATYSGAKIYKLAFLQSADATVHQNLVTVSTVPLPAGGVLLISGIAGIAALRRKRKA